MEGARSNVLLFLFVFYVLTDSIRKFVDKSAIKFARGVKLETKNGKTEDRILVSAPKHILLLDSVKGRTVFMQFLNQTKVLEVWAGVNVPIVPEARTKQRH